MKKEQPYLSKGVYSHPQIKNFILVKQFMFLRNKNKKCLTVRFANDSDFIVNAMFFCVVQLDAAGKELKRNKVAYTKMNFEPGRTFTADSALAVDEKCVDFRIILNEVYSKYYKYVIRAGQAVPYYAKPRALKLEGKAVDPPFEFSSVKKRIGSPKTAIFLAILALLSVFAINVWFMTTSYLDAMAEDERDMRAAAAIPEKYSPQEKAFKTESYGLNYAEIR